MIGGEFATARRGIDPASLRYAHGIVQRAGYQAASLATGIAVVDLKAYLLPPPPRQSYTPLARPVPVEPPKRVAPPVTFKPPLAGGRTFAELLTEIAEREGFSVEDLLSQCKTQPLARVRQAAYWEIRQRCPHLSYPDIGRRFGGRDHTTILHGVRAHEKRMAEGKA